MANMEQDRVLRGAKHGPPKPLVNAVVGAESELRQGACEARTVHRQSESIVDDAIPFGRERMDETKESAFVGTFQARKSGILPEGNFQRAAQRLCIEVYIAAQLVDSFSSEHSLVLADQFLRCLRLLQFGIYSCVKRFDNDVRILQIEKPFFNGAVEDLSKRTKIVSNLLDLLDNAGEKLETRVSAGLGGVSQPLG